MYLLSSRIIDTYELYKKGSEVISSLKNSEPLIVVSGRAYNLYDEKLNLRLGQNLSKIGMNALPMDFFDVRDVSMSDFSSMYWSYGTQMLRVAKVIKKNHNFFAQGILVKNCDLVLQAQISKDRKGRLELMEALVAGRRHSDDDDL